MIHRTNMAIGKNRALITTPCLDDITANRIENYRITTIAFEFHDSAMKLKLLWKLLDLQIRIDEPQIYFFNTGFRIEENILELIELLAPVNIAENTEMQKAAEEYLNGVIGLEKLKQKVVAYCVARKLSE